MALTNPIISIGVLAHNEAPRIGATLGTLFAQDIFEQIDSEVIVVANGCTDDTAIVARECIDSAKSQRNFARVEEISIPGKSNAWNEFVHRYSSPSASVLVLMDADIKLLYVHTISAMISALQKNFEAVVCVDRPIKDIQRLEKPTLFQRLLIAATPEVHSDHIPLCGQLYCARSSELRQIKLPNEISCEDGFLRALLLTKGFSVPENPRRIILESRAAHSFRSVGSITELFKHERWLVAGSIVSMLLFKRFSTETRRTGLSAMDLMKKWEAENPYWVSDYIRIQAAEKGWRILPRQWWFRRLLRLQSVSLSQILRRLPIAVAAFVMDIIIFIAAIRDVRIGRALEYLDRDKRGGKQLGKNGRND